MSNLISPSRIPYIAAVNGKRVNCIVGCGNGPEICAVRDLCWARRSCEEFAPAFHPKALDAVRRLRRRSTLFWDFGGDRCSEGVDPDWRRREYEVMAETPQHTHVTLTKAWGEHIERDPPGYAEWHRQLWMGASITDNQSLHRWLTEPFHSFNTHYWLSFEPVLGWVSQNRLEEGFQQAEFVVIGGLSDGAGRVIPPDEGGTRAEWVAPIIEAAHEAKCGIFLKNLPRSIITQITNPRTGRRFESMTEMRDIPEEWVHG